MLQIISGKFFQIARTYDTPHRGVFYTNYRLWNDVPIEVAQGRLSPTPKDAGSGNIAYEIIERIEWSEPVPGVMISTGGEELVSDFAAVMSFALNVTCTTDQDLASRLIADPDPYSSKNVPRKYLRRIFDAQIDGTSVDGAILNTFLTSLVGLRRREFVAIMKAIRRYVMATHRVADDASLAYSLLVMSVEALSRTVDTPPATWLEYDEAKRHVIDKALDGAPDSVAERVRAAVLANAHAAVGRQFRDFVLDHLGLTFFRDEAVGCVNPVARPSLAMALRAAYDLRSSYVHRLAGLPKLIASPLGYSEMIEADRAPHLTLEGLARLARHVIMQFVSRAPKVDHEAMDWFSALPNIMRLPMAPHYWLGNPDRYGPETAGIWLETFLGQLAARLRGDANAIVTDLSPVLDKIETLHLGSINANHRRSIIALYHLFVIIFGKSGERPHHKMILAKYGDIFNTSSVEELAIRLVIGEKSPWTLEQQESLHRSYYVGRTNKNSLRLGGLFESLFTLRLAEANRVAGNEARARELIAFAVEAAPGQAALTALEEALASAALAPIDADGILLPQAPVPKEVHA